MYFYFSKSLFFLVLTQTNLLSGIPDFLCLILEDRIYYSTIMEKIIESDTQMGQFVSPTRELGTRPTNTVTIQRNCFTMKRRREAVLRSCIGIFMGGVKIRIDLFLTGKYNKYTISQQSAWENNHLSMHLKKDFGLFSQGLVVTLSFFMFNIISLLH